MKKLCFYTFILLVILGFVFSVPRISSAQNYCRSDIKGFCKKTAETDGGNINSGNGNKNYAEVGKSFVVPGLEFLKLDANASLGDILIRIYTFALGLVGLSAFLMLIFGGVRYATATETGVKQAKEWMTNAVVGLILALLSWLILFVINPDFVQKMQLKLEPITTAPDPKTSCTAGAGCDDPRGCKGIQVCAQDGSFDHCEQKGECTITNTDECVVFVDCGGTSPERVTHKFPPGKCEENCQIGKVDPFLPGACGSKKEAVKVVSVEKCGTSH